MQVQTSLIPVDELRRESIIEELGEVESIGELNALWMDLESFHFNWTIDPRVVAAKAVAKDRLSVAPPPTVVSEQSAPSDQKVKEIEATIAALLQQLKAKSPEPRRAKVDRKYKLLSTNVDWSTKPQVHTVMAILAAHMRVGDVVDESKIVEMMVANEGALNTTQGGKRIWDYYKGDHVEGLQAHGNVQKL